MDTRIYIMTHKKCNLPKEEGYYPLQVGAALHDELQYEKDNTGDNISEKNSSYCELTGIYWIWKNAQCDNVGICHYRRYYCDDKAERIVRKKEYEDMLKKYDVIVPRSMSNVMPVYAYFSVAHKLPALDLSRKYISENCPVYLDAFDRCMDSYFLCGCNMMTTRKELFNDYCEWLFPILFDVERVIRPEKIEDSYQRRIMGFLSERLLRVWIMMQDVRVKEIRMAQTEDEGSKILYGT